MSATTTEKELVGIVSDRTAVLRRDGDIESAQIVETKFGVEEETVAPSLRSLRSLRSLPSLRSLRSLRSVPTALDKPPEDATDYPDGGYGWVCCACAFMVSSPLFPSPRMPADGRSTLLRGASTRRSGSTCRSTSRTTGSRERRTSTLRSLGRCRCRSRS